MPHTHNESDADRRVFVGYILTIVAVLTAIVSVARGVALGDRGLYENNFDWLDRIAYAAQGNELLGIILLGAAFLLMLESATEPKTMKISIAVISFLSLCVVLASAISLTQVLSDVTIALANRPRGEAIIDYIAAAVLAAAASFITWPVISNLSNSNTAEDVNDAKENETTVSDGE